MEPRAWVVAVLFGLAGGIGIRWFPSERRIMAIVLTVALAIGAIAWVASPQDLAGPSLVGGTAAALVGSLLSAPRNPSRG